MRCQVAFILQKFFLSVAARDDEMPRAQDALATPLLDRCKETRKTTEFINFVIYSLLADHTEESYSNARCPCARLS